MSTDLVPFDFTQLPSTSVMDVKVFDDMSKGGGFLPRLQLFNSNSKAVSRPGSKLKAGHYGIVRGKDDGIDFGPAVDILPFLRRPKAIDTSDKPAISIYDPTSAEFKRIKADADVKDSGCQWGPSFLVVVRGFGLAEFFLGSSTFRPEAQKLYPFLPHTQKDIDALAAAKKNVEGLKPHGPLPCTLRTHYIEAKHSWYVPTVNDCSVPFAATDMPNAEDLKKEIEKFLSIKREVEQEESAQPARAR